MIGRKGDYHNAANCRRDRAVFKKRSCEICLMTSVSAIRSPRQAGTASPSEVAEDLQKGTVDRVICFGFAANCVQLKLLQWNLKNLLTLPPGWEAWLPFFYLRIGE